MKLTPELQKVRDYCEKSMHGTTSDRVKDFIDGLLYFIDSMQEPETDVEKMKNISKYTEYKNFTTEETICNWIKNTSGIYSTCKYAESDYNSNKYKYCPHCGKPIQREE